MRTMFFIIGLLVAMPAQASTVQSYDLWLEFTGQEDFRHLQYCDYTSLDPVCSSTPQPANPLRPVGPFSDLTAGDLIRFTATVENFGLYGATAGIVAISHDCEVGDYDCSGFSMTTVVAEPDSFDFWFQYSSGFRFVGETAVGSAVRVGWLDELYYDWNEDYSVSWSWDYYGHFSVVDSPILGPQDPAVSSIPLPAPLGFLVAGLLGLGIAGRARRCG